MTRARIGSVLLVVGWVAGPGCGGGSPDGDGGGDPDGGANTARADGSARGGEDAAGVDGGTDAGGADAAPDKQDAQMGTFNMAGNTVNEGGVDVADAVVRSVESRGPAFLALNEVCENQIEHIRAALPAYSRFFDPVDARDGGPVQTCDNSARYGNAVLYRGNVELEDSPCPSAAELEAVGSGATPREGGAGHCSFDLPTPATIEQRRIACVVAAAPSIAYCSVHMSSGDRDAARRNQAAEVARIAQVYGDRTRIIAGDFNVEPGTMSEFGFGEPGTTAALAWADSDNEETLDVQFLPDRKLDYILVSSDVTVHDADATSSDHSDHDPLWADVAY